MMLNMGQWLSIPFVILGVACMLYGKRWTKWVNQKENSNHPKDIPIVQAWKSIRFTMPERQASHGQTTG